MQRRPVLTNLAGLTGLGGLCALTGGPASALPTARTRLLAAWQQGADAHIGLLHADTHRLTPLASLPVPTRAHGLCRLPGGRVLAVARRPGDWLLHWHPDRGEAHWHWLDDDRRLNGHAVVVADGARVLTKETDGESGRGVIGVRSSTGLSKHTEWPTHGSDPHQLLCLPARLGAFPAGTVLVANGGVTLRPETGRAKPQAARLDSSLVALDPCDGSLLGQWRLADPWLSIRHLAWQALDGRVGIALQAEHAQASQRAAAPVLAIWDGRAMVPAAGQPQLQGYGGDVCAHPLGGFVVSCPRADVLAHFAGDGAFVAAFHLMAACALAHQGGRCWSGGRADALCLDGPALHRPSTAAAASTEWAFDNHWQATSA